MQFCLKVINLSFQVKVVDEKKFKHVVEEEIRKLDRQENESLPQVALSLNNVRHNLPFLIISISSILSSFNIYFI